MKKAFVVLLVSVAALNTYGGTLFVDLSATGNNDGTSWSDAFTDLQDGLTAANTGDEIWVADGTYKPTAGADRYATFQLSASVAVYGGFNGSETNVSQRDWGTNVTVLSGDIGNLFDTSDNCYTVVMGATNAMLDGFTIQDGNANGGGVGTDPTRSGGGMYNNNVSGLAVANCTFRWNRASTSGGGMWNYSSSPTVTNCAFSGNSAYWDGGISGGGMYNESSSPTVTNCTFSGNWASTYGGGMYNYNFSSPTVTSCTFSENTTNGGGGWRRDVQQYFFLSDRNQLHVQREFGVLRRRDVQL